MTLSTNSSNLSSPTTTMSSKFVDVEVIKSDIKLNKEHKKRVLTLENKILEIQLSTLKALEKHYIDYKLDFELKRYGAELEYLKSKKDYLDYRKEMDELDEKHKRLFDETITIDDDIKEAEFLLAKYRSLDPKLLAEYQSLKDDLEVQDMLIEISENN